MRIRYRFAFRTDQADVTEFLKEKGISYTSTSGVSVFFLFEDDACFDDVKSFFESHEIGSCLHESIFTQREKRDAEWLCVRSTWRPTYPYPTEDKGYVHFTYDTKAYCSSCGAGLMQKNSFMIQKKLHWSSRNFFMLNWIHDELFLSPKAQNLLSDSQLTGFRFMSVFDKSGRVYPEISQLFIENTLKPGLSTECIRKVLDCPKCGRTRFLLNPGGLKYARGAFEGVEADIVKSDEQFGEITCSRKLFVSQRMYQALTASGLDRCLVFEPVELV